MPDIDVNILTSELQIANSLDVIAKLEDNNALGRTDNLVKWKDYCHQVVIESDSYFYKIYEEDNFKTGPFYSVVRNKLAEVYENLGLYWKIITFEKGNSLFNFEQRQKLPVACEEDCSYGDLLLSVSNVLDKTEKLLELDSILDQVKSNQIFQEATHLKLFRSSVNNYEDYGFYKDQAILFDDADWYLAFTDDHGNVLRFDYEEPCEFPVHTSYGFFLLTNYISCNPVNGKCSRTTIDLMKMVGGWVLYTCTRCATGGVNFKPLKSSEIVPIECLDTSRFFAMQETSDLERTISLMGKNELVDLKNKNMTRNLKDPDDLEGLTREERDYEDVLYSNNAGKRSFQWELWHSCNNLCSFCYLGNENRHTDTKRQVKSLKDLLHALDNLDFSVYNNISLIGGEFFQGQIADPEVNKLFFQVIDKICDLYNAKKIGSVWITATLTIGEQLDFYKMLDTFEQRGVMPIHEYGASGVWICTSWDPQGRFHSKQNEINWQSHMKCMTAYYPFIKKNTTIILTQKLCEMYLDGDYDPLIFTGEFDTVLFYKQPGLYESDQSHHEGDSDLLKSAEEGTTDIYLTNTKRRIEDELGYQFFPTRKIFRKFLLKYAKKNPETYERLFNIMFRADELHRNFNELYNDNEMLRDKESNLESSASEESIINPNCLLEPKSIKHIINYATYHDCNKCMICDRNQIWKSVNPWDE